MYQNGVYTSGTANVPRSLLNEAMDLNGVYVVPVGGRVFHVRGSATTGAILTYDDQYGQNTADMNRKLWPSVASVLGYCVANRGDTIIVHKNHTENIASAAALTFVAGLRIVGLGWGATRPTFTFTTATATLTPNVAGVTIQNCRWLCAGPESGAVALTVAAPFTVTGEGFLFVDNHVDVGYSATQICTTFMTIGAAGACIQGNRIYAVGGAAAAVTNVIVLGTSTLGYDGIRIQGNYIKAATGATTTGVIANASSSATGVDIIVEDNYLHNMLASSTKTVSLAGNTVTTGYFRRNVHRIEGAGIAPIAYSGTGVDINIDGTDNCINTANKSGGKVLGAGASS